MGRDDGRNASRIMLEPSQAYCSYGGGRGGVSSPLSPLGAMLEARTPPALSQIGSLTQWRYMAVIHVGNGAFFWLPIWANTAQGNGLGSISSAHNNSVSVGQAGASPSSGP